MENRRRDVRAMEIPDEWLRREEDLTDKENQEFRYAL
jgi:hypothetical protein